MAKYKIKLEDDTLFDYESQGTLDEAVKEIMEADQFIACKDYRGKSYYVNKIMIKIVNSDQE